MRVMSEETKAQEAAAEKKNGESKAEGGERLPKVEEILEALKVVKDPEIPVNVVDLGLIYNVHVNPNGVVDIDMTLTAIGCPVQDMIRADAELAVLKVPGVKGVNIDFVWSPPWTPARMTEEGKKQLRMLGYNI